MFVPFITKRSTITILRRQKGGGGGASGGSSGGGAKGGGSSSGSSGTKGGGSTGGSSSGSSPSKGGSTGGSSSSGGTKSGGSSTGSTGGSSSGRTIPVSSGGTSKPAVPFGKGGGSPNTIPSGQAFAGRTSGGGTRAQVYGNRQYGSGYPGITGRGVAGRNFPFVFWPIAWAGAGVGTAAYLHDSEYGNYDNSSRPGGILTTAAFTSSSQNTTFRLLSDSSTVLSLIEDIVSACSSNLQSPSNISAANYNGSLPAPKPEQTVQYYRASTAALTLDGYNDTSILGLDGTPDIPLPSNIDTNLLNCLNNTIGEAVPLIAATMPSPPYAPYTSSTNLRMSNPTSTSLVGLAYLGWCLLVSL